MSEFAAQRSRIEKIINAAQSIQERIVCGICLELFKEPVTIRCGHRFCRNCILKVTNNENSACPFCNNKIRKRSIPIEGNKIFQLFVNQFLTLIEAIKEDSGIDVLEPSNKPKNTKESVPLNDRPSTSKFEETSSISKASSSATKQNSTKSKIKSQSSRRNSLTKKQANKNPGNKKNTLDKYLSNKSDNVPDQEIHSEEKVKSWLNNITPHIDDAGTSDSNNEDGSPFLKKVNEKFKVPEILESTQFVGDIQSPGSSNYPDTSKVKEPDSDVSDSVSTKDEEVKYKETQSRIKELEMIARRKKSNLNLSDKTILKTASSVPAASHSDAYDWRRVKKFGKEMQAKTFKSLNVSVEKSCPSMAVDNNVPSTSSTSNDNNSRRKLLKLHDNSHQRETPKTNNSSMDTTGSHKGENVSLSCIDEQQVNDIIGILPAQDDLHTPERTRNVSSVLNKESIPQLEKSNLLIRHTTKNYENDPDDNLQNSPSKHKLSLKKNLTNSSNSKLISSQNSTSDKTNQSENNSPRQVSPERPKSRLSLRLSTVKTSDQSAKQSKSAISNHDAVQSTITHHNFRKQNPDNDRNSTSSRKSHILFKKLGKICKKRKNVPFIHLGKLRPKIISNADNQDVSSVLVKSNVPVNFEIKSLIGSSKSSKVTSDGTSKNVPDNKEMKILSPEEDSQLKYLAIESPHRQRGISKIDTTENINKSVFETSNKDQSHVSMEVDQIPPTNPELNVLMEVDEASSFHNVEKHKPDLRKENNSTINEEVHVEIEDANCKEISKHPNEENVEDNGQSDLIKASTSKNRSKIETPVTTTIFKSTSSVDSECCEDDKESNCTDDNQNSSPIKAEVAEDEDEEQNVVSISLKQSDKLTKGPNIQKIVQNHTVDLTDDESDADSKIRHKSIKTSVVSRSTPNSVKETNKYSEAESNADSDVSDAKIRSKSRRTSSNSTSTLSSARERDKISEDESNADSDVSKIRRRSRKTSSSSSSTLSSVKERNKVSEAKSDVDVRDSKVRCKSKKMSSSSASTASSIKKCSKKKRTHSDSSNDDEDVTSIIGKWCGNADVPVSKKAKIVPSADKNLITDQDNTKLILTEDDNDDVTLVGDENQIEPEALQRDPPIDDIISKVKSFKEIDPVSIPSTSKLVTIQSSLLSADLFESNEPCMQPSAQISPKQVNSEAIGDKSQNVSDTTLLDLIQMSRKKSNMSESSDGSNKENSESNKMKPSPVKVEEISRNRIHEIEHSHNETSKVTKNLNNTSQTDAYQISESLMNITQEQLALKRIEKDLIGIDLSTIHDNKNKVVEDSDKYSTPQGKKNQTRNTDEANEDDDFDPDNIDATPCAKKSRRSIRDALPNHQLLSKFSAGSQINSSEIFSPGKDTVGLIPAITPVKNRKSYPLCHSTPVINAPDSESQSDQPKIVLVCSGLLSDQIKTVQKFAKRFNGKFQTAFNMDVTHVITSTNPKTKVGQRTFKYIQGIAFQKHVVSFQWILDCLNKNALLDEEDEKYDVLDADVLESGAKKSRKRQQDLFENFAFFCLEPFTALSITEFKNILAFNGAVVVDSLAQLAAQKNKYRIVILPEDFDLNEKKLNALKKAQCALVSFDWIVDSLSQYHAISIAPYLQETTTEELLALGFPAEYLVEEEFGEEDEGDELE